MAVSDDPAHAEASALRRSIEEDGGLLLTSDLVMAEALTRLRYDRGVGPAIALSRVVSAMVEAGAVRMVFLDQGLWSEALSWLGRFDDQRLSMADCTSFAIMTRLGLQEALTADHHFAIAGFTPLAR